MTVGQTRTVLNVVSGDPRTVDTALVVIPVFEGEVAHHAQWSSDTGGEIERAAAAGEFNGELYALFLTPLTGRAGGPRRLGLLGAGPRAGFSPERARKLAAGLILAARHRRIGQLTFVADGVFATPVIAQAVAEGMTLGEFDAGRYKTFDYDPGRVSALSLMVTPDQPVPEIARAVDRGRVLAECSNLARQLANEPGNTLTPTMFADRAMDIAGSNGVAVEVLDERQMEALGMGLLLGVARGSSEPPRLIVLRYEPPHAPAAPVLGLVGKGVTFDSGGISIKPADGMDRMKDDMAGGAAVIAAMRAISILQPGIRVVGVVPTVENMPGGRALKPGDVIRSACGKTVEVLNTDAEGRLILGDALWYAQRIGATHLVDVATLTGACVVALGKTTTGLFGTPPAWVDVVRQVADAAGDRCWPMPLVEEYREQLKSEIADMANVGGRPGGAITAALFLNEFTGGLPWAHLDIAGTAWAEEAKPYLPKGPSGVAVRTLAELPFTTERWPT